jgi:phosphomannomutase
MALDASIFKAYDIRGIYPSQINEENIGAIVSAIYQFLSQDLKKEVLSVVLSRDMRVSSPSLFAKAKQALDRCGAMIIDVGLASTPTFYFAVLDGQYDTGIQISASHNPKEYNGIKFVKRIGETLIKIGHGTGMDQVKELAMAGKFAQSKTKGETTVMADAVVKEVDAAMRSIKLNSARKFKVVADPANAMGALYLEELFKRLPCELIKMNFELDGTFPAHQPDPLQFDTLKALQKRVIDEKADLGIAPDGDGDRVFFINEKGEVVPATLITSLIAKEILTKTPGETIIADIRDIMNVKNVCQQYKGKFSISKVGHALITEQLNRERAAFAGESSGHYYFRETGGAESSVRVILYLLGALEKSGMPVSRLLDQFQTAAESGEFNFLLPEGVDAKTLLANVAKDYKDGQISHLDGLAIDFPDWRFNIRASNTEPLLRLNLEANSEEVMKEKLALIIKAIQDSGAKSK